jgi:MFS family permease
MSQMLVAEAPVVSPLHPNRLFAGSCVALIASAMMFVILADIAGSLRQQFILSNRDVGWIIGGSGWGFVLGIIVLGPLCDVLGMRRVIWLAIACHATGIFMMIFANGFWMLFWGATINMVGGGAIEAACNPLIATIYPKQKTHKLNQFHMWFPGGIVIGGLLAFGLYKLGLPSWQLKLAVVLVPIAIYAAMLAFEHYPLTERVQSGVTFGEMVRESLSRPLFLLLLLCMMLTASLELGPQRWIPSVLQAGGVPGILVLVWITGLMAILRYFAGPVVRLFGNIGLLLISSVLAGIGLLMLSMGGSVVQIGVAATIFALGVCYFWPTMLGTAAERVPRGGAMALALLGGIGGLFVNVVTTPVMGHISDRYSHGQLAGAAAEEQRTLAVLEAIETSYAAWAQSLGTGELDQIIQREAREAVEAAAAVRMTRQAGGSLPSGGKANTINTLRLAAKNGPVGEVEGLALVAQEARKEAEDILGAADNHGGLISFRYVAPMSLVLIGAFGGIWLHDRRSRKLMPRGPSALA